MRKMLFTLCIFSVTFLMNISFAISAYPERPITVVVGYNAGGSNDAIARTIAPELQKILGQPIVIVNKGGAGGTIAINDVLKKPADGYTIGFTSSSGFCYEPLVRKVPFTASDPKYLATIAFQQMNIYALEDAPYNSLTEMIEYAKKNNAAITIGYPSGLEGYWMRYIAAKANVKFRMVPTKSGAETIASVLGKHVDAGSGGGPEHTYVLAGKIKRIFNTFSGKMVGDPKPQSPEEAGFPEVGNASGFHYFAPADLPGDIVKTLGQALIQAAKAPSVLKFFAEGNFNPAQMTSEETLALILDQQKRVEFVIKSVESMK